MKKYSLLVILISLFFSVQAQKKRKIDSFKIEKIDFLQFPISQPNGECWDNTFGECFADVYPQIRNTQSNATIEKARIENLQKVPASYTHVLWSKFEKEGTIYVDFYDYDSMTKPDFIGTVVFKPSDHLKDKTVKLDNQSGLSVILYLDWYASED